MRERTRVINKLIADNGYESYLEIGIGDPRANFQKVLCDRKLSVDPEVDGADLRMSSDNFFEQNEDKFDLIFIDGLHHSDQVEKDIVNAYKSLNKGGCLLIHDCRPDEAASTVIPRGDRVHWMGDVYRATTGLIEDYSDKLKMEYHNDPAGLLAVYKKGNRTIRKGFTREDLTFAEWKHEYENKLLTTGK